LVAVEVVEQALEEAVVELVVYSTQRKSLSNAEFQFLRQLVEAVAAVLVQSTTAAVPGVRVLLRQ
jgi:hypothetical protein